MRTAAVAIIRRSLAGLTTAAAPFLRRSVAVLTTPRADWGRWLAVVATMAPMRGTSPAASVRPSPAASAIPIKAITPRSAAALTTSPTTPMRLWLGATTTPPVAWRQRSAAARATPSAASMRRSPAAMPMSPRVTSALLAEMALKRRIKAISFGPMTTAEVLPPLPQNQFCVRAVGGIVLAGDVLHLRRCTSYHNLVAQRRKRHRLSLRLVSSF